MPIVSLTDIDQTRLNMAKTLGADETVLITSRDAQVCANQIVEVMGTRPDITVECSGAVQSIQTAIYVRLLTRFFLKINSAVPDKRQML